PIDVTAHEGGAGTWNLGEPPLPTPTHSDPGTGSWGTDGWQPPALPDGGEAAPAGFWEGTDDWTPTTVGETTDVVASDARAGEVPEVAGAHGAPTPIGDDTWAGSTGDANPWTTPDPKHDEADGAPDVNPWTLEEWPRENADQGAWDHHPDPAAVDSGFY